MKVVAVTTCIGVLALVLELGFEESLENSGAKMIVWLQTVPPSAIIVIFHVLEAVVSKAFLAIGEFIYLCINRKIGKLAFIANHFGASLIGFLKVVIAHPRPFWVYEEVQAMKCSTDYGTPSGHSLTVGACMIVLIWSWIRQRGLSLGKVSVAIAAVLVLTVYRTYLGVHFYFQICFGLAFSLVLASVILTEPMQGYIHSVKRDRKALMVAVSLMCLLFAFSCVMYLVYEPVWDPAWSAMHYKKCLFEIDTSVAMLKNTYRTTKYLSIAGFFVGYHLSFHSGYMIRERSLLKGVVSLIVTGLLLEYENLVFLVMHQVSPPIVSVLGVGLCCFFYGFLISYLCPLLLNALDNRCSCSTTCYTRLEDSV